MTYLQRRWHRRIWLLLGPLLLAGIALSLYERPRAPESSAPAEPHPNVEGQP